MIFLNRILPKGGNGSVQNPFYPGRDLKWIKEAEDLRANGIKAKINLLGNPEVNRKIREFEDGLVGLRINKATGVTLKKRFYFPMVLRNTKNSVPYPVARMS